MARINKLHLIVLAGIVLASIVGLGVATHANPLEFLVQTSGTSTVTATTSVTYLTTGTATSTSFVFDTYSNGSGNTYATNALAQEIQFTASSTSSTLNWYYEYAQGNASTDCITTPTSCDWYQDNTLTNATTSLNASVNQPNKYSWTFASTSQGGAATTGSRGLKMVTLLPVARYVRAVFTLPAGSANGAVWSAFIGQKQSSN